MSFFHGKKITLLHSWSGQIPLENSNVTENISVLTLDFHLEFFVLGVLISGFLKSRFLSFKVSHLRV